MLTLVISTPNNPERLNNVHTQMTSQGLTTADYELVPAQMIAKHPPMGICQSFKKCIEIAQERKAPYVNIFEDDMLFLTPNAYSEFMRVFDAAVPKWDFDIYLGGIYDGDVTPFLDGVATVSGKLSGLHCIVVPERFYHHILNADENINLDHTISQTLKARMYVMYPMGIIQRDAYSYNARQVTEYNPYLHTRYKLLNKSTPHPTV